MNTFKILFLLLFVSSIQVRGVEASIGLSIPLTDMTVGMEADIPIYADHDFTGREVLSYTLQFSYNTNYIEFVSVETEGTIAAAFGAPAVNNREGILTITAAGSEPLSGTGVFLKVRLRALNAGWIKLAKTNNGMNLWNEGSPLMTQTFDYIRINSVQTFSVWSSTTMLAKGERTQYSENSYARPIHWAVGDTLVATIDSLGWLTAVGTGKTIVIATDTNGVLGVSSELEVRPARLTLPTDLTQWPGDTIDIPMWVSDLSGLQVLSGQIRLGYNSNVLEPITILQEGTLLEHSILEMKKEEDQLLLVFAGSEPIPGNGTLLMIRFVVKPTPSGATNLNFLNVLLNENMQVATTNGYFNIRRPAWRYIYPNDASLIVGETAGFTIQGDGVPPYTWSVSNPALAEVDANGNLTAYERGTVILTATDSVGISVSTNPLIIQDTRIQLPDTGICYYEGMMRYPVRMDALPRSSILSIQARLSYDSLYIALDRVEFSETIPVNWSLQTNQTSTSIQLAASGSTPLTTSGDLLYLWFRLKPSFHQGAWVGVQLEEWLFNEGRPTVLMDYRGNIQGKSTHSGSASIHCDNANWTCLHDSIRFHSQVWNAEPVIYQWMRNGVAIPGASHPDLYITTLNSLDTVSCKVTSLDPCIEDSVLMTNSIIVYIKMPPAVPDSITGDTLVFTGDDRMYEVHVSDENDRFLWKFPPGFTVEDFRSIAYVTVTDSAQSGYVTVSSYNECGISDSIRIFVGVRTKPVIPDSLRLYGATSVCGTEQDLWYRIPSITNMDSYHWELPDGFSGTSSVDSINVTVFGTPNSGEIKAFGVFEHDTTFLASLFVQVLHSPDSLGMIWGPETIFSRDSMMYSVTWNSDIEYYEWMLPEGLSGNARENAIMVAAQDSLLDGWISVVGHNRCGISDTSRLHVWYYRDTSTYEPKIWGAEYVCVGEDSLVYRLDGHGPYPNLYWQLPVGLIGHSSADTIIVRVSEQAFSGTMSVMSLSPIGPQEVASLYIEVSSKLPAPDSIVGPTQITGSTDSVVYSISEVPNAHFYIWNLPTGMSGWSETNQIAVFVADSTFEGTIRVQAFNWCGPGLADSIQVSVSPLVGMPEVGKNDVLFYPNPFHDILNVRYGSDASLSNRMEIYDATGRMLQLKTVENTAGQAINFEGYSPGIYLIKLNIGEKYSLYKVMKR